MVETGPEGAPLIVLVHGSMDRGASMHRAARLLEDDYRVARYDRRGYGRSKGVGPPFTMAGQVEDLLAVIDGRPAIVFGHSMAGNIALAAAARHPAVVRAAGVYESPMSWEPWWPHETAGGTAVERAAQGSSPQEAAEVFMRLMVGDELWDALPAGTKAQRRAEGPALVGELTDLRRAAPYDPAHLTMPLLVARGSRARPQHRLGAAAMAERLGDRRGVPFEFVVVDGAGHGLHRDDPPCFAGLVRRLAELTV